jgi:ABC-type multidrug transport system ATPase subunit
MLAFITFSLTNHGLSPAKVFSSLALFNSLRLPLNLLPLVIGQTIDGWASMKRIQEYLMAEEQDDDVKWDYEAKKAVEINSADFTWERTPTQDAEGQVGMPPGKPQGKPNGKATKKKNLKPSKDSEHTAAIGDESSSTLTEKEPFQLRGIDLTLGRNELVAIIGGVGSGKSSLLAALAGDMRKTNGEVIIGASRAFCPQYAWIQNATVKDNILFGKEMDRVWYSKVIEACALQPDLEMLPNGDMTEIGERGITVSGGQKQRLNIARAIYFNSDIVLMDDPLSAVDAHVGRHIFDKAINGLLKNKCRILATHQLWVLNRCDRIIWMNDGRIEATGTFNDLMANNQGFANMMVTTAVEKEEEKKEDAEEGKDEKKGKKKWGKKNAALMQVEERAVNSVPWSVYAAYIKASGSLLNAPIVFGLLLLSQAANISCSLWLSWWTAGKYGFKTGTYVSLSSGIQDAVKKANRPIDWCICWLRRCTGIINVWFLAVLDYSRNKSEQDDASSGDEKSTSSSNVFF